MKVEELINSDSLIVVDGEYTDGAIRQAYTEGYNEAMRWRDPGELPLGYESDFLIKYESGEIRRFKEDPLFDIITHWRPIE